MKQHIKLLGLKCRDRITNVEGYIESVCFDLYGCVQASINIGVDKEGKRKESYWMDVKRLEVLSKKPIMEVPNFDLPEIGASDKPSFSK